ncbi:MAG: CGNR zinc finger domain-containing protein [Acidimicrobiales bacterium]
MQVASVTQSEIRVTLETAIELINGRSEDEFDVRNALEQRGFSRASNASAASISRLDLRMGELEPLFVDLPGTEPAVAISRVNEQLTEVEIAPSIVAHDGVGPHMHWTPTSATFDEQVVADVLMALAHELCDNGTSRFGHCAAESCDDLFYDATRNRSRRFCDDPKCASRTHTAHHRARQRS